MLNQLFTAEPRTPVANSSQSSTLLFNNPTGGNCYALDSGYQSLLQSSDAYNNVLSRTSEVAASCAGQVSPCDDFCGLCERCTEVLTTTFGYDVNLQESDLLSTEALMHTHPAAIGDDDWHSLAQASIATEASKQNDQSFPGMKAFTRSSSRKRKRTKKRSRLTSLAVILLQDWFFRNKHNPYPSMWEKARLAERTSLTVKQVETWFNNARQRLNYPDGWDPLEIWLSSSSEDEAADINDIRKAAAHADLPSPSSGLSSRRQSSAAGSAASSMSSWGSAFDTCPQARMRGPAKRGRKTYGSYAASNHGSMSSAASSCSAMASPPVLPFPSSREKTTRGQTMPTYENPVRTVPPVAANEEDEMERSVILGHFEAQEGDMMELPEGSHTLILNGDVGSKLEFVHGYTGDDRGTESQDATHFPESTSTHGAVRKCALSSPTDVTTITRPLSPGTMWRYMLSTEPIENLRRDSLLEHKSKASSKLQYQCTFCHIKLSQGAWKRHEESQHLPQKQFVCMPYNSPQFGNTCVFCKQHVAGDHEHSQRCVCRVSACLKRSVEQRTFTRKDKLEQHVKAFHKCSIGRHIVDLWAHEPPDNPVFWDCGFCDMNAMSWDERSKHIANHFREGKDMSMWRGAASVNLCL